MGLNLRVDTPTTLGSIGTRGDSRAAASSSLNKPRNPIAVRVVCSQPGCGQLHYYEGICVAEPLANEATYPECLGL
jgi:hypothetical protein